MKKYHFLNKEAFTLQQITNANCFRYVVGNVQIVFGVAELKSGWAQEVWIPYSFSEEPVIVISANNEQTVAVTNRYTNRFYCYSSGECYINWIAIGKC